MPYFYKNNLNNKNLLFIHIPKTGGTSIDEFLSKKYKIELNEKSLFGYGNLFSHTYQHCTYQEIFENELNLNIDLKDCDIFTIVRNPYNRIISELFYINKLNKDNILDKNLVFNEIKNFLEIENNNDFDNHRIQQYKFLIDKNDIINDKIKIFYNENLTKDFRSYGFNDFNLNLNNSEKKYKNNIINKNYFYLLNNDSIKIINDYYKKDFELFNYHMFNSILDIPNYDEINEKIKS